MLTYDDILGSHVGKYLLNLLGCNALSCGKQHHFEGKKVKDEGSMFLCKNWHIVSTR
jgi:hypothetical protein